MPALPEKQNKGKMTPEVVFLKGKNDPRGRFSHQRSFFSEAIFPRRKKEQPLNAAALFTVY